MSHEMPCDDCGTSIPILFARIVGARPVRLVCRICAKLAPFKVLWKDANPRSGSYFQKSLGGTDPRTEMYAEACAAIWGHYQPDGFTLTDDLRTIRQRVAP